MKKYYLILREIFYFLTCSAIILTLLESGWNGMVLAYFNINWLLISWVFVGIVILLINPKNS
ncbi:MAG: hypothetical protein UT64_C0026G0007 [Candidatus Falkowbacteria bacterium GW2011_GWF2_39_8]|uniref:Uncharacterized protein n=1 Tax=Candidatus Falkowbacteria bacterium GW2011_GWF2_39_8 TaxID=1618642 RepID=A0A0G0SD90_9BACT|nr:MAG: hypothetical protein UT64_C0026G0007 [Candidatus Falkowbacteria bacterium GW2011_GWF2_39_8]